MSKLWRLWRRGYTVVLWNVDPKDFGCDSSDQLRRRLSAQSLSGGDVILLHDNHAHAADVLPEIISTARARQLDFCRVSELTGN